MTRITVKYDPCSFQDIVYQAIQYYNNHIAAYSGSPFYNGTASELEDKIVEQVPAHLTRMTFYQHCEPMDVHKSEVQVYCADIDTYFVFGR